MLHNPMPIKYILKDNTAETEPDYLCGGAGVGERTDSKQAGKNFAG